MAFSAAPVLPGGQRLFAAGGINFNAGGRAYEQHSPMIAGASSGTRVWNEPETRGEAYIPFANDWRRSRAQDIWLETGKRIGMIDQTPSGGPSGSGGGGGGGASGAGGMVINFNPTFNIPGYLGDQSQLNRAIAGALKSGEPQMRAAFIDAARRASVK
jgi:hypothetical protein